MARKGRYELKYLVDEPRARAIVQYVRAHLQPSRFNIGGTTPGEPVVSLYLDSPDLILFRQVASGHKNRLKLRIRFYDDCWEKPAFLELKRRLGEVISKDRAPISREGVLRLLTEGWPTPRHWPEAQPLVLGRKQLDVYHDFWNGCNQIRAAGVLYVSYVREAYELPGSNVRVTLDRRIAASTYDGSGRLRLPQKSIPPLNGPPYHLPPDGVVLELKFDHRAPNWMYQMVRTFGLVRCSVSKYCACLGALGLVHPHSQQPAAISGGLR